MRIALVYRNGELAGFLTQRQSDSYEVRYTDEWFNDPLAPAISLALPKTQQVHTSNHLFPFFFNLLSEGVNRKLQCRLLKIDEKDHFSLLLATAGSDTIGAIDVKEMNNK